MGDTPVEAVASDADAGETSVDRSIDAAHDTTDDAPDDTPKDTSVDAPASTAAPPDADTGDLPDLASGADADAEADTRVVPSLAFPIFCSADNWCGSRLTFSAVWGSASDDVWVVGDAGTSDGRSALLHWNGASWSTIQWRDPAAQWEVRALWGSAANDIWAVGTQGLILHFDGTRWTRWGMLALPPPSGQLTAIWGRSRNDVWAIGEMGVALHWDGGAWTSRPTGVTSTLSGIWGSSAGDVWAVGGDSAPGGDGLTDRIPILLRWDGSAWNPQALPGSFGDVLAVWGSAANDVWIAGIRGYFYHWNGTDWEPFTPSGIAPATELRAIWGSGPSSAWAVGSDGTLAHWDGTRWYQVTRQTTATLNALWGLPNGEIWVVGDKGTSLHRRDELWNPSPTVTDLDLYGIWGSAADDVWIAGAEGTLTHWNGMGWTSSPRITTSALVALWGAASDDVWCAGAEGTMARWNGLGWSLVPSATGANLGAISGIAANDIWAAGDRTAVHWDGTAWSARGSPSLYITSLLVTGHDDVWGAGNSNVVLHWQGSIWSEVPVDFDPPNGASATGWSLVFSDVANQVSILGLHSFPPYKVPSFFFRGAQWDGTLWTPITGLPDGIFATVTATWASGPLDRWVAGLPPPAGPASGPLLPPAESKMMHRTGSSSWALSDIGTLAPISEIWGSGPDDVWAVGSGGTILRRRAQ